MLTCIAGPRITFYHVTKLPGHPPYEGHYFTASADLWDAAVDHSNIPPHSTCQTCVLVAFLKSSYRDSRGRTVSSCFGGLVLLGRSFRIQRVLWHTTSVVALARDVCQSGLLPKFQFGRSPWPLTKSPNIERVASLTDFSDIRRPMRKVRSKKASRPEGGLTCPRDRLSRLSLTLWCSRRFFEGSNHK